MTISITDHRLQIMDTGTDTISERAFWGDCTAKMFKEVNRKCPPRNMSVRLSTPYTDPEPSNAIVLMLLNHRSWCHLANKSETYCEQVNYQNFHVWNQGDHSPDTLKFPDISLTMCGTHAHVKWYS